ncbi:hypothetical protein HYPSUDRAFT_323626 [Hypholoma sublateritium FD-334 SS-4]|uniref:Uncharacterized protein n=1 Tax=Hypholoma sublateritium (strain FD-334 SS-4) TaxID=945553 RepID=A0A0D2KN89_HYPSF|nr:hypothetical protein HYPSUDRAFT_323626 [Hypholoma sublateritium FD-334 SS-4]
MRFCVGVARRTYSRGISVVVRFLLSLSIFLIITLLNFILLYPSFYCLCTMAVTEFPIPAHPSQAHLPTYLSATICTVSSAVSIIFLNVGLESSLRLSDILAIPAGDIGMQQMIPEVYVAAFVLESSSNYPFAVLAAYFIISQPSEYPQFTTTIMGITPDPPLAGCLHWVYRMSRFTIISPSTILLSMALLPDNAGKKRSARLQPAGRHFWPSRRLPSSDV